MNRRPSRKVAADPRHASLRSLRQRLAARWPITRVVLPDGGFVAKLSYPFYPAQAHDAPFPPDVVTIMVGRRGDGTPVAFKASDEASIKEGLDDRLSKNMSSVLRELRIVKQPLEFVLGPNLGINLNVRMLGDVEVAGVACDEALARWLKANSKASSEDCFQAVKFFLSADKTLAEAKDRLVGSHTGMLENIGSFSGQQWFAMHGADGKDGWLAPVCLTFPGFQSVLLKTAGHVDCPMSPDRTADENLVTALRFDIVHSEFGPTLASESSIKNDLTVVEAMRAFNMDGSADGRALQATFQMLRELPQDWLPRSVAEWRAAHSVARFVTALSSVTGISVRQTTEPCKGRWQEWKLTLAKLDLAFAAAYQAFRNGVGGGTWGGIGQFDPSRLAGDVSDMLSAFVNQIVRPMVVRADPDDSGWHPVGARHDAATILFPNATASGMVEMSNKWHARRAAMESDLAKLSPHLTTARTWPSGLPPFTVTTSSGREIEIVPLTTQQMLVDEGSADADLDGVIGLDHCVGGFEYLAACMAGTDRIVSLRERVDGKVSRISTAQFRIRPHDFHAGKPSAEAMSFQLMQHRGRKNENPSEEIREALRAYHERLTGFTPPRLPINPEAFRALENKASLSDACGYDATDDAAIKGALRLWEPLLPRPLRGLSLDEFAGEIGIPKQDAPAPR